MFCPKCGDEKLERCVFGAGAAKCLCCGQSINQRDEYDEVIPETAPIINKGQAVELKIIWKKGR